MKHLGISSLAVLLLLAAGCAWLDRSETEDYVILQAALGDVQVVSTKGTPTTSLGNTFNVWAYVYPASGSIGTPNYTCGEVFTKQGATTTYESALIHGRIPTGYTVKYWALTPETVTALGGLSALPNATTSGVPSFSYTVPSSVASQTDLLVACTDWAGGSSTAPALAFQHVLSGVQFYYATTGSLVSNCTIKSISVTEVKPSGTYTEGNATPWVPSGATQSYSVSSNVAVTALGQTLYAGANTLMLIPQTLPSTARLQVTYSIGSGSDITATASLDGFVLSQGSMIKFYLTIIDKEITFNVVTAGHGVGGEYTGGTSGNIDEKWS